MRWDMRYVVGRATLPLRVPYGGGVLRAFFRVYRVDIDKHAHTRAAVLVAAAACRLYGPTRRAHMSDLAFGTARA